MWSPVSHTNVVNSIVWVQVGVKKTEKNQKNSKKRMLRVRLYCGSGCDPWNNGTKEKFETKKQNKKFLSCTLHALQKGAKTRYPKGVVPLGGAGVQPPRSSIPGILCSEVLIID